MPFLSKTSCSIIESSIGVYLALTNGRNTSPKGHFSSYKGYEVRNSKNMGGGGVAPFLTTTSTNKKKYNNFAMRFLVGQLSSYVKRNESIT